MDNDAVEYARAQLVEALQMEAIRVERDGTLVAGEVDEILARVSASAAKFKTSLSKGRAVEPRISLEPDANEPWNVLARHIARLAEQDRSGLLFALPQLHPARLSTLTDHGVEGQIALLAKLEWLLGEVWLRIYLDGSNDGMGVIVGSHHGSFASLGDGLAWLIEAAGAPPGKGLKP